MDKRVGLIIALTGFSLTLLAAQTPAPTATPEASPTVAKHKHSKKKASAEMAASPSVTTATASASPDASPTVTKRKHSKKEAASKAAATPAMSPVAPSPTPARRSWFPRAASPAPTNAPVGAASPAAATSAPVQTAKPLPQPSTQVSGGGPGMVWVNTESHIYHKAGSRWYGRTKKGKYMSEQDALKEGDRADKEEGRVKKQP